jgi:hypothetical protein
MVVDDHHVGDRMSCRTPGDIAGDCSDRMLFHGFPSLGGRIPSLRSCKGY